MDDDFGLLANYKALMIINQPHIEIIILRIDRYGNLLGIPILNRNDSKVLTLLAKGYKKLTILNLQKPALDPQSNPLNHIALLIIKPEQPAINMIFLKTHNRPFSNDGPGSYAT
jgi:hypothetical protein